MTKAFKYNYHKAKRYKIGKIVGMIANYPKHFSTPKYLTFMQKMSEAGWEIKVYEVGVSKYVFVEKEDQLYKIRFSNHKPLYIREVNDDCDFYVGISHTQVSTTEQLLKKLLT